MTGVTCHLHKRETYDNIARWSQCETSLTAFMSYACMVSVFNLSKHSFAESGYALKNLLKFVVLLKNQISFSSYVIHLNNNLTAFKLSTRR